MRAVEGLDDFDLLDHDTVSQEVSNRVAWEEPSVSISGRDAVILGELSKDFDLASDEVEVMEGALPDASGRSSPYLIYAESTATKQISPSAVPRLASGTDLGHLTPYESFLISHIDGLRSVLDLKQSGLLAEKEMLVSLLALLDRGVITFEAKPPVLDASLLSEVRDEPAPIPVTVPVPAPAPAIPKRSDLLERKAAALHAAAVRDREAGNVVSARMNLKLAIAFHPSKVEYQRMFTSLEHAKDQPADRPKPVHPVAQRMFDEAGDAERRGDVDEAIRLLERALGASKEPLVYNRLGVILATRKRDFARAQAMLEEATRLAPDNPAYVHNLGKVLAALAIGDGQRKKRPSFWSKLLGPMK